MKKIIWLLMLVFICFLAVSEIASAFTSAELPYQLPYNNGSVTFTNVVAAPFINDPTYWIVAYFTDNAVTINNPGSIIINGTVSYFNSFFCSNGSCAPTGQASPWQAINIDTSDSHYLEVLSSVDVTAVAGWYDPGVFGAPNSVYRYGDEVIIPAGHNFVRPLTILSPVEGALEDVNDENNCSGDVWCFNQHRSGYHYAGGGIGDSDDTQAWDANLNYPSYDYDDGQPVYATTSGIVAQTYAGVTNAGGSAGQVLIEHQYDGHTWWSGYLHLDNIQVNVDDEVTENTIIGYISNTGTTNNHLHFVVYTGENSSGGLVSFDPQITER